MVVLTSVGDAPGVTTSAFALTTCWPRDQRVLLAECSPSGGRMLRGYFRCHAPAERGLWHLALAAVHGENAAHAELWRQTIPLDKQRHRLLLAGLTDPFLSVQLSAAWPTLAEVMADLPVTVLADIGAIGPYMPIELARAAAMAIVVIRPTLAQLAAARPRLARLRQAVDLPIGLCVIGHRPYTVRDVQRVIDNTAITLTLPDDPSAAEVLAAGVDTDRLRQRIQTGELMRAATHAAANLDRHLQATKAHHPPN